MTKLIAFLAALWILVGTVAVRAEVKFGAATGQVDATVNFGSGADGFSIDFVTIGRTGNPADTSGEPESAGRVNYAYAIAKFEISRDMVVKANDGGGLGITLADMSTRGGNGGNRPATGISWNEAARFVNWLNTSQGFPAAYRFARQPGDEGYDVNSGILKWRSDQPGYNSANPFRNSQARYVLPGTHEWYKAAYFDPSLNKGAGGYWNYPTGSDVEPLAVKHGTAVGTAVYRQLMDQGLADVDQAGGLSPNGVMGLGGNVWEWEETEWDLVNSDTTADRGLRGGAWDVGSINLSASSRLGIEPSSGLSNVGFRVVIVPEPTSGLAGTLGICAILLWKRSSR